MATITDRVRKIIADYNGMIPAVVQPSSTLDGLGLDSLDVVKLSMEIEDEFGIEIPTDQLDNWTTVGDVILYLDRLQKENPELVFKDVQE